MCACIFFFYFALILALYAIKANEKLFNWKCGFFSKTDELLSELNCFKFELALNELMNEWLNCKKCSLLLFGLAHYFLKYFHTGQAFLNLDIRMALNWQYF